jgi:hypothetical protein
MKSAPCDCKHFWSFNEGGLLDLLRFDWEGEDALLLRSAAGNSGKLSENGITAIDICWMMKRRLAAAGMQGRYAPYSFRSCTATYL